VTPLTLQQENRQYRGRGGVSAENASLGLQPAFMDRETGRIFASCFADGHPAVVHIIDGLPDDLVIRRNAAGKAMAVKDCVVAGFVCRGQFFTREQAALIVAQTAGPGSDDILCPTLAAPP
jgi:hypothetical protein